MPQELPSDLITGADPARELDALFVNAPLRDYDERPRVNDFTLPVLGMAYIATYAATCGFNVGVLDAEAHGLGIHHTARLVNAVAPRWAGFNLLAPTYEISARIAVQLDPGIKVMLGGHQAKAMPAEILLDPRMRSCEALVIGEGETRVAALLDDHRRYLAQDPHHDAGRVEANMVGARGCPYDCSFCGAAVSANPDITIRTRQPDNILAEMHELHGAGVTAFRFVDDLFLGARRVITTMMRAFTANRVGEWARWDATGRINVLARASNDTLDALAANGLREVALGSESGSQRMLTRIDKRVTPAMTRTVVRRLAERGINVKGYFILGFPGETCSEIDETVYLVHELWETTETLPGRFNCPRSPRQQRGSSTP